MSQQLFAACSLTINQSYDWLIETEASLLRLTISSSIFQVWMILFTPEDTVQISCVCAPIALSKV